jgi:transcription antitermination factor NusG
MDEETNKYSQEMPTLLRKKKNREEVRWYVLVLPASSVASAPLRKLQAEQERREKNGESLFDFFAPTCVTVQKQDGQTISRQRPLLYNYVFIHASENEIFRLKRVLPYFNFLPRVFTKDDYYFPYVTDAEMENLRWIASSYSNELPLYEADTKHLVKGDRIRITTGALSGLEAEVIKRSGTHLKDVVVRILDNLLVSLYTVKPGEYELISLSSKGKHQYAHLSNDRYFTGLHAALGRYYTADGVTEADCQLAEEVLHCCAHLELDSDVLRSKCYSLLLISYKILAKEDEFTQLMGTLLRILPLIKAEHSAALLMVTIYGCTDNRCYYERSHEMVDAWRTEENPKKNKRTLLEHLDDYDRWFGHTSLVGSEH